MGSASLDQFSKVEWMLKDKHEWAVTNRDQADRALTKAVALQFGLSATCGWDLQYAVILPGDAGEIGTKGDVVLVGELVDQMERCATKAIFVINARTGNTVVVSDKSTVKAPNKALVPTATSVTPAADAPVAPAVAAAHL